MGITRQYNYHCKNDKCNRFVAKVIIEKDTEFEDAEEPCDGCSKPLYRVGILNAFFVTSSRTPQQMQKMLKKRSRDHYAPNKDEWHQKNSRTYKP